VRALEALGRELLGLFVDDSSLALVILALLGAVAFLTHASWLDQGSAALALVGGAFAVLLENVVRTARRSARR
jgi:hypothetical protein